VNVAPVNVVPLTGARFPDLVRLFGPNGANSGCWCMWWRVPAKEWTANGNAGNRAALHEAVRGGEPVGLLAYDGGDPVGWTAVAPRTAYPRLLRSPTLKLAPADEAGVWSVTCFYIHRKHRRQGVALALLAAAVEQARAGGATVVEGYPVDTGGDRRPSGDLYTGTVALFTRAGFRIHARPASGRRVVMRFSAGCLGTGE
jgi:GNAT superfamily N-acetyltransferase